MKAASFFGRGSELRMRLFFGVLFRIAVPMPQLSDECCHCKIEKHRFALCCIGSVGAVAFVCFGARLNWLVGKKVNYSS
ncbi:hypothetical protein T4B_8639 [Trichinella pseudospiralis]|uniref:Transmembrane protein n=1 Tax=Trichinella pseudospiralis TaxID=6337 RepID=A0A0V1DW53_TRIPS|nr:hypothetical protein T4A_4132 [Trichinella pseudospiralis]KRZ03900.1 hypothetical protein T4B_9575 [Trichinella pseudospiralis]KRZ05644.1 hypothetical protein T4B_8639 [Trichinella pseudospiralis]KRZ25113.1 hypothetical protein T4C_1284 [Trichinella pseudospiralis]